VEIYRSTFRPMLATLAGRDERVMMKLVIDARSRTVLGVHVVGHGAAEMIQLLAVPLRMGATKDDFDATLPVHPRPDDEELIRSFARRYLPDGEGPTVMLKSCLFTNSPDRHFILDRHPAHPEVVIAAGFSGHGYKFCSVIGEIMADVAQHGRPRQDIEFFRLGRFAAAT
jgi:glycine/D-amino acid oxidase-like deaminating enzyme